jgi:hypothetical protein
MTVLDHYPQPSRETGGFMGVLQFLLLWVAVIAIFDLAAGILRAF